MTELEKATKGMELCLTPVDYCEDGTPVCHDECPYFRDYAMGDCLRAMCRDALALMKTQEPVSVQKKPMEMCGFQTWSWVCGKCGQTVLYSAKFCPWCGRAVKWE